MVQLNILSGGRAGVQWQARRFPVSVGRDVGNDLRLEEGGIWGRHFQITCEPGSGIVLTAQPDALVAVNDKPAQSARLRNGDSIQIGSVRLQFWLGQTRQRGLRYREWLVWGLVTAISLGQVGLVYWLLQ